MFFQLIIGFLIGLLLQIIFPFLTQSVVDVGIGSRDIGFIKLILLAQLMLYAGSTFMDFIRNWLMLHLSTRINLSLLTDFFIKLMKLPMSFFDTKMTGDITQRMTDYGRIQTFLTNTLLDTSFSLVSFVVFTFIAVTYSVKLFFIFLIGSILYFLWLFLFLPSRKRMDFRRFSLGADNSNETIEMITGMQEIKLNNCERQKRWKWEKIQARIFRLSIDSLLLNQVQSAGALFINQGKNIFITYVSATEAVNGNLSIGSMMAVQYIMGQLNNPVQQIIRFVQSYQDAKISMERIDEIHSMEDEDAVERMQLESLPAQKNIEIKNLSFKYPGYDNEHVLIGMDLSIPAGKTTAIVGMSGSGKTTLLKLLLRYYQIEEGSIKIGNSTLASINTGLWRSRCGVVMQDGFIFSDTIAANIAVGDDYPDHERLMHAMKVANIEEFVDSLPLGLNTIIGGQGKGISQGQKQRILIARAVYKEPDFVFLDEATNSLDANNETAIMNNLADFLKGKTVVVVAHRLSTVRNADQIVVLDKGCITEIGTHAELTARKKDYYRLVRNQLELGN
jgi:ATP-binding cassette subfamily B protein